MLVKAILPANIGFYLYAPIHVFNVPITKFKFSGTKNKLNELAESIADKAAVFVKQF